MLIFRNNYSAVLYIVVIRCIYCYVVQCIVVIKEESPNIRNFNFAGGESIKSKTFALVYFLTISIFAVRTFVDIKKCFTVRYILYIYL